MFYVLQVVTQGAQDMGLAGAGQSESQDVDAPVDEAALGQLVHLLPQRQGHPVVFEEPAPVNTGVSRVLPEGSLDSLTELDVSLCFAPLLRWVLTWWCSDRLALAVDPTLKGDDTTAIVISVVYRGCAIPVAWRILHANKPGAWMDPIVELLQALAPAVPEDMTVIVLCDRGLASPKLWKQILAQGWHPYMRYPKNVTFCAEGGRRLPARAFVPRPDTAWTGSGTAFSKATVKRRCTLLAVWYVEQEEPWIILTDLPPDEVGVSWYALRFWIELGFKAVKSLGWQWQKTRRTDPARISRHWFVLSVATLLTLAYGTRVEDAYDRRLAPGSLRAPPRALAPTHRAAG